MQIGQLKSEPCEPTELIGLVQSGIARLDDAKRSSNSLESRFDLAYNASHALALAALRWHGYRASNRYIVFQALVHTVGLSNAKWRVLSDAHNKRNRAEYEGKVEIEASLVDAMIRIADEVADAVKKFVTIP
ncbi:MAG TPA: hypothetical protein VFQ53_42330 [Kofleriaceae bacterium]|nr:hypothetical protein [Kofleriaceae bacterium]